MAQEPPEGTRAEPVAVTLRTPESAEKENATERLTGRQERLTASTHPLWAAAHQAAGNQEGMERPLQSVPETGRAFALHAGVTDGPNGRDSGDESAIRKADGREPKVGTRDSRDEQSQEPAVASFAPDSAPSDLNPTQTETVAQQPAMNSEHAVTHGSETKVTPRNERGTHLGDLAAGTSVAQTQNQMKRAANRYEFASSGEQDLPVRTASAPESRDPAAVGRPGASHQAILARVPDLASMPVASVATGLRTDSAGPDATEGSTVRLSTQEKLLHLIQSEVQLLGSTKADRLSVVLRPDAQTEILLRLRVEDGCVEAHARCNRGNVEALNAQWGQLQQALSACGVRLSALATPVGTGYEWLNTATSRFGTGGSSQDQRHPQQSPASFSEKGQELPSHRPAAARSRARQRSQHLLEQWA
jgi:hypothetical protein